MAEVLSLLVIGEPSRSHPRPRILKPRRSVGIVRGGRMIRGIREISRRVRTPGRLLPRGRAVRSLAVRRGFMRSGGGEWLQVPSLSQSQFANTRMPGP